MDCTAAAFKSGCAVGLPFDLADVGVHVNCGSAECWEMALQPRPGLVEQETVAKRVAHAVFEAMRRLVTAGHSLSVVLGPLTPGALPPGPLVGFRLSKTPAQAIAYDYFRIATRTYDVYNVNKHLTLRVGRTDLNNIESDRSIPGLSPLGMVQCLEVNVSEFACPSQAPACASPCRVGLSPETPKAEPFEHVVHVIYHELVHLRQFRSLVLTNPGVNDSNIGAFQDSVGWLVEASAEALTVLAGHSPGTDPLSPSLALPRPLRDWTFPLNSMVGGTEYRTCIFFQLLSLYHHDTFGFFDQLFDLVIGRFQPGRVYSALDAALRELTRSGLGAHYLSAMSHFTADPSYQKEYVQDAQVFMAPNVFQALSQETSRTQMVVRRNAALRWGQEPLGIRPFSTLSLGLFVFPDVECVRLTLRLPQGRAKGTQYFILSGYRTASMDTPMVVAPQEATVKGRTGRFVLFSIVCISADASDDVGASDVIVDAEVVDCDADAGEGRLPPPVVVGLDSLAYARVCIPYDFQLASPRRCLVEPTRPDLHEVQWSTPMPFIPGGVQGSNDHSITIASPPLAGSSEGHGAPVFDDRGRAIGYMHEVPTTQSIQVRAFIVERPVPGEEGPRRTVAVVEGTVTFCGIASGRYVPVVNSAPPPMDTTCTGSRPRC